MEVQYNDTRIWNKEHEKLQRETRLLIVPYTVSCNWVLYSWFNLPILHFQQAQDRTNLHQTSVAQKKTFSSLWACRVLLQNLRSMAEIQHHLEIRKEAIFSKFGKDVIAFIQKEQKPYVWQFLNTHCTLSDLSAFLLQIYNVHFMGPLILVITQALPTNYALNKLSWTYYSIFHLQENSSSNLKKSGSPCEAVSRSQSFSLCSLERKNFFFMMCLYMT